MKTADQLPDLETPAAAISTSPALATPMGVVDSAPAMRIEQSLPTAVPAEETLARNLAMWPGNTQDRALDAKWRK